MGQYHEAASQGDIETLKKAPPDLRDDVFICACAAEGGHLDTLKWLREHEYVWDVTTCSWAAAKGHIHIIKWARDHGCPWNENTCWYAADKGQLETLQWLRNNGCPWDEYVHIFSALNGHMDVVKWANKHGCPRHEDTCPNDPWHPSIDGLITLSNGRREWYYHGYFIMREV